MSGLWTLLTGLGRWFGLLIIVLAILGGLINGIVTMVRFDFWSGFYGMFQTWVFGIFLGLLLIFVAGIAEGHKGA